MCSLQSPQPPAQYQSSVHDAGTVTASPCMHRLLRDAPSSTCFNLLQSFSVRERGSTTGMQQRAVSLHPINIRCCAPEADNYDVYCRLSFVSDTHTCFLRACVMRSSFAAAQHSACSKNALRRLSASMTSASSACDREAMICGWKEQSLASIASRARW